MRFKLLALTIFVLLLSACTATVTPSTPPTDLPELKAQLATETAIPRPTRTTEPPTATPGPSPTGTATQQPEDVDLRRVDDQGAVVVQVTPDTLSNPGETITFTVAMNTHSVDLSMNLAELAVLMTDTGLAIRPLSWDGMAGGHHVFGNLVFSASVNGQSLLEEASILSLVIQNVDVPERTFSWEIGL